MITLAWFGLVGLVCLVWLVWFGRSGWIGWIDWIGWIGWNYLNWNITKVVFASFRSGKRKQEEQGNCPSVDHGNLVGRGENMTSGLGPNPPSGHGLFPLKCVF